MRSVVIRHFDNDSARQFLCEGGSCHGNYFDHIYSWDDLKVSGWLAVEADTTLEKFSTVKLSETNKGLRDSGKKLISIYCPDCAKEDSK